MTEPVALRDDAPKYELRIAGHLDERWSTWFDGLAVIHEDDGTTTLRGAVVDQAALHGLLARVRDLGATLISLAPVDACPGRARCAPPPTTAGSGWCCRRGE